MDDDQKVIKNIIGIDELSSEINELANLFVYKSGKLTYDNNTQKNLNRLLTSIATRLHTFENTAKNEKENIEKELTIIDTRTGEVKSLIDIDSMRSRVENVLSTNNIYSCLKSLALSNKCAHSFDGPIKSLQNIIIKYYNLLYPGEIDILYPTDEDKEENITFGKHIKNVLPRINTRNLYDMKNITINDFDSILNSKSNANKQKKIKILNQLNIQFDIRNDTQINELFNQVISDKKKLIDSYLIKTYDDGKKLLTLQSQMFAVKDYLISMIGQLLQKGQFKSIKHELIETPNTKQGFRNMLIIDDRDLSYYIEVHMPDFIAEKLIRKYRMRKSATRETSSLGASAIYTRSISEIKKILKELRKGTITDGITRASIITRGFSDGEKEVLTDPKKQVLDATKDNGIYSFTTDMIVDKSEEFESFLEKYGLYPDELKQTKLMKSNENYSKRTIEDIVNSNYLTIYDKLSNNEKKNFILYSINNYNDKDYFSINLYNFIENNIFKIDIDDIGRIILYKNSLKKEFIKDNYKFINNILNDNIKINKTNDELLNDLIYNYINDTMGFLINNEKNINKEDNNDGPKRRR